MSWYNKIFDWFIPEEIKNDILQFGRAKMTVGIGLLIGLVVLLQSVRSLLINVNLVVGFAVIGFGTFVIIGPFLMKWTGSRALSANWVLAGLFILASVVVIMRGGMTSTITSYLAIVSLCAMIMLGLKTGIVWGVLSTTAMILIYSLKQTGMELPVQELSGNALDKYNLVTYSVLVVFVTILGGIFENNSNGNFLKFNRAEEQFRQANAQLMEALENVNRVMKAVSESDLSERISYQLDGELERMKSSVNNAIELLSRTVLDAVDTSSLIHTGAQNLSDSAKTLADGTSTQAASLEQISSSMNEIENLTRDNNQKAGESKRLTRSTLDIVNSGNQEMEEMVTAMNTIAKTGHDITKIVKVIDEIAFQTNLLALNAAVEAARAGKYGKGFSVVAEEVRNLAGRSAEAAKNTTELVETSIKEMERGVERVDTTAKMLGEIMEGVDQVNGLVNDIASGSEEQRNGIEEMAKAIDQVNDIVQQNSAISEQTSSASQDLKNQSLSLQQTMQRFRLKKRF